MVERLLNEVIGIYCLRLKVLVDNNLVDGMSLSRWKIVEQGDWDINCVEVLLLELK